MSQLIHHQHRIHGRDVVIHSSVRQQQLALQTLRLKLVGLIVVVGCAVLVGLQQALPLLGPIIFIDAVVVIAGFGDSHLEDVGVTEHGVGCGVAAAGMAVDAGAVDIDPGVALRELLHARDLVRKGVVAHVAEVGFVELLGAPRSAHAIDLYHDEAQLGERLAIAARGREVAAADAAGLRTGVDMIDDRILLCRVEISGLEEQAV